MKGWDLKEGEIRIKNIVEIEIFEYFKDFFKKSTTMKNIYKLILLKSLITISDIKKDNKFPIIVIEFGNFFKEFTIQNMSVSSTMYNGNSKYSSQELLILNLKNNQTLQSREKYIKETKKNIKLNVLGALYGDFEGTIYSFNKKEETLILNPQFQDFMFKNSEILLELIDYRMIEFLKLVNPLENLKELSLLKKYNCNVEEDFYKKIESKFKVFSKNIESNGEKTLLELAEENNELIKEILENFN